MPLPRKLGLLDKIYGSRLESQGIQWVRCSTGTLWKLDLSDVCHRWMIYGIYEGGEGIEFAKKCLNSGGVFIDSGSNIGQWLMYLAEADNIRTLSFEPVTSQRLWLNECLNQQESWNVEVAAVGLGDKQCEISIQCHGARSTIHTSWYQNEKLDRETIALRRLDQVLTEKDVESVRFWKLDVEGAELSALHGAANYLNAGKIDYIHVECHPKNYLEVKSLLENNGYELAVLCSGKLIPFHQVEIDQCMDIVASSPNLNFS